MDKMRIKHTQKEYNERLLMGLFWLMGKPNTMIDMGCGNGAMVDVARGIGIDAVGIDIVSPQREGFIQADLSQPIDLGMEYDLVLCLEVAEHIPLERAGVFCQNLARHSRVGGRLIFSAAMPGQDGDGHLNCQPPTYWRSMLWDAGKFSYQEEWTSRVKWLASMTSGAPSHWLPANIQVF